uniref:Uncharacterized protein n=1 Tax=Fagus sylvatica TaxID=28930 RepID=A0A2N9FVY9_FAGSY
MIGGGEEAPAAAGSSQPLEWKFEQVFGERAAGEEVQEDLIFCIHDYWCGRRENQYMVETH